MPKGLLSVRVVGLEGGARLVGQDGRMLQEGWGRM